LAAYKQQQQLLATPQYQSTSKSKKSKKSSEKKAKKKSKKNDEDEPEGNDEMQEECQVEKVEKKAKSKKKSRKSVAAEPAEEGAEPTEELGNVSDNKRTKSRKKSKHVDTEAPEDNNDDNDDDDDDDAGDVVKFRTKISTESQNPNKRYLSRNRGKVVNYNENRSRSPTPDKRISVIMKTPTVPKDAGHQKDSMNRSNSVSGIKESNVDHPPIVLRISKVRLSCFSAQWTLYFVVLIYFPYLKKDPELQFSFLIFKPSLFTQTQNDLSG
jgi:hypothetical protein